MIKKLVLGSLLSATILAGSAASAEENNNYYVKLNGGLSHGLKAGGNFPNSKLGNTGVFGAAVGYQFNENFRADVSIDYRAKFKNNVTVAGSDHSSNESNKIKSYATMVNVYYDITEFNKFTPYITLGAGVAQNRTGVTTFSNTAHPDNNYTISKGKKNNFIYKAGAGAKYAIDSNFDINLQYQFVNLGKFQTGTQTTEDGVTTTDLASSGKVKTHEFLVGVSYKF